MDKETQDKLDALTQRLEQAEAYVTRHQQTEDRERRQREFKGVDGDLGYSFRIRGDNTPFIEFQLAPGKEIVAEPGSFMFKTEGVNMSMALGDGSERTVLGKLWSATKRKIGGEKALLAHFNNAAKGVQSLALAASQPGEVIALDLQTAGGSVTCQRGAFMAASGGTNISVTLPKRISTGLFSGEGFILQKISGDKGHVFLNAGGNYATYNLREGDKLQIDTGCVLAMTESLAKNWKIEFDKSPMSMLFNERGLFLTTVEGPGTIWVQSMPFSRQVALMGKALEPTFKRTFGAKWGNS